MPGEGLVVFDITPEDVNSLTKADPLYAERLKTTALIRTLGDAQRRIDELEKEIEDLKRE